MDPTTLQLQSLQKAHMENQKIIEELKKQNQFLRQTLENYNAALSRCLVALGRQK